MRKLSVEVKPHNSCWSRGRAAAQAPPWVLTPRFHLKNSVPRAWGWGFFGIIPWHWGLGTSLLLVWTHPCPAWDWEQPWIIPDTISVRPREPGERSRSVEREFLLAGTQGPALTGNSGIPSARIAGILNFQCQNCRNCCPEVKSLSRKERKSHLSVSAFSFSSPEVFTTKEGNSSRMGWIRPVTLLGWE